MTSTESKSNAARRSVRANVSKVTRAAPARFDLDRAAEATFREQAFWTELIHERRRVSRLDYTELTARAPALAPRPRTWRYAPGEAPRSIGRRPSHATR